LLWGGLALVATGLAWLALHTWWPEQTAFGPQPRPAAAWLLRAHGALAWLLVAVGGAVWQSHVRSAWRTEVRRWTHHRHLRGGAWRGLSGVAMIVTLGVLLLTAIGLQYAPDEAHATLSWVHWLVGVAGVAVGVVHWAARHRHARPVAAPGEPGRVRVDTVH
jgi:hypothetical protein